MATASRDTTCARAGSTRLRARRRRRAPRATLRRAHGGRWLAQELTARQENLRRGRDALGRQLERLTEAYLGEVIPLAEYQRRLSRISNKEGKLWRLGKGSFRLSPASGWNSPEWSAPSRISARGCAEDSSTPPSSKKESWWSYS